ncbi:hypothetical protein BDR04DRAFT_894402 [Suillus decipiens]|nr:hypothetical protein BDR04DRAFT_894402 [Suillus decipiens]
MGRCCSEEIWYDNIFSISGIIYQLPIGSGTKYCAVGTSIHHALALFHTYLFLGFCFGGLHAFNLAKDSGLIVCAAHILALCHPCA